MQYLRLPPLVGLICRGVEVIYRGVVVHPLLSMLWEQSSFLFLVFVAFPISIRYAIFSFSTIISLGQIRANGRKVLPEDSSRPAWLLWLGTIFS